MTTQTLPTNGRPVKTAPKSTEEHIQHLEHQIARLTKLCYQLTNRLIIELGDHHDDDLIFIQQDLAQLTNDQQTL